MEILGPYSQNFSTPEKGKISPIYKLSPSYVNCLLQEECSRSEVEDFANWYYDEMDAGQGLLDATCGDKACTLAQGLLKMATNVLTDEYDINDVSLRLHNHKPK